MARKPIVIALGALAAIALVARRRRGQSPVQPESNGSVEDSRESLRRFVEAGERMRSGEQPTAEL